METQAWKAYEKRAREAELKIANLQKQLNTVTLKLGSLQGKGLAATTTTAVAADSDKKESATYTVSVDARDDEEDERPEVLTLYYWPLKNRGNFVKLLCV